MIRYIFCISPGRSGSDYLSKIFAHAGGVRSVHEGAPQMNGRVMRSFLRGNAKPMQALMPRKMAEIERLTGNHRVYAETNHCFIKGFGWLLPGFLKQEEMGVVLLRRDTDQVVNSFCRIHSTPVTRSGRNWVITPSAKNCLTPLPESVTRMKWWACEAHRVFFHRAAILRLLGRRPNYYPQWVQRAERELTQWYVTETYARADAYRARFPDITYCDVALEDLNSHDGVAGMFQRFGLKPLSTLSSVIGKRTNLALKRGGGAAASASATGGGADRSSADTDTAARQTAARTT